MLRECRPVRQIGQGIVVCKVRNPLFGATAFGDVFDDCQQVLRLATVISDGEPFGREKAHPAIRHRHGTIFNNQLLPRMHDFLIMFDDRIGHVLGEEFVRVLSDHLVAGNA